MIADHSETIIIIHNMYSTVIQYCTTIDKHLESHFIESVDIMKLYCVQPCSQEVYTTALIMFRLLTRGSEVGPTTISRGGCEEMWASCQT